jgi:signal transduction histidine kinase
MTVGSKSSLDLNSSRGFSGPGVGVNRSAHDFSDVEKEYERPTFVEEFQKLIDGLPEQIALLDERWSILAVNSAWITTAALYGYSALQPKSNYLDFCRLRSAEGHSPAAIVVSGIDKLEADGGASFRFVYHGKDRWEGHAFELCVSRFEIGGRKFATVTRYDVSELVQLRRLREEQGHHDLERQFEERRRIARELHDSTLQLLGFAIGRLKRSEGENQTLDIIADMEQLLGETQQEIRSISYLGHPPLLKEMGLEPAVRELAEGFARRTGLTVDVRVEGDPRVEWRAAEISLYRVVQEALSNVFRHARATRIELGLFARESMVHAVVADNGIGIPSLVPAGVGLASMRERLAGLGGRLSIRSGRPGATIIASIPARPPIKTAGDIASFG